LNETNGFRMDGWRRSRDDGGVAPARVVIADDHVPMRALIRRALERGGFEVCAEAGDAAGAVAATRSQRPDVVLLDVDMPGDGIRAAAEIAADAETPTVVMLSVSRTDEQVDAARRAGAAAYLLKGSDRLPDALTAVLAGPAAGAFPGNRC
jgi:DNA-binding NarL/FixJ family response regulator